MHERELSAKTAAAVEEAGAAGNSAERLLLFTDAVAAIAITLLVLPLVDIVPSAVEEHVAATEVISGHLAQIGSFILSFAVIARLWLTHHRVFAMVVSHRRSLVVWNMAWLLAIVVLPFPTEMAGAFGSSRFVAVMYYLNVLAAFVCQTVMTAILRAHPAMVRGSSARMREYLFTGIVNTTALVVALAIALGVPALQYYSLLLLAVDPAVSRLRRSLRMHWAASV
ncbi:TMEM175 family protein [Streptomyces sp. NPDC046984]|uniref:TMEM175 family protein n=1 Tax=Streptomyces sp. NPDC046984 TaxID=3155138 RepID=UPI00340E504E